MPSTSRAQMDLSMEDLMACVLGDAVWRLVPGRLDGLLRRGYELPTGAEDEITLIKRDLEEIIAILEGHSNSKSEDHGMTLSCWTAEVRELSYDMEDFIDQCEHAAGAGSQRTTRRCSKITRPRGSRRSKTTSPPWLYEKLRQRLWMANKLREFSRRVQEALQRQSMCRIGAIAATAGTSTSRTDDMSSSSSSSWHPAPSRHDDDVDVHVPVGIDSAMNRLEWLIPVNDQDGERQKVNVVSIVGPGGVGKTTLANELYRKHGWQFECRAFVRTSQKPDIRRILISMLTQICPDQPPDNWKVHSLISSIRTHLQDKRYLIIIDDIWATSTWDIIRCALPDGNNSSRILVTTEIEDLAVQPSGCDSTHVFLMKPLSEDDSRKLFFSSLFGSQRTCPPELREASYEIVRKCGGLPLAIITIASLLASQKMGRQEQWDYINKYLGYSLVTNPTLERLKDVLNLSYNNLPHHLKACLLYMSIYQEDNVVSKVDLVTQWIAEGFICPKEGRDKQEIAGAHCFDELIRLKMILPVDTNDNGEVLSCVVHHIVLNFLITYKSMPENFVTAIHHSQAAHTFADKVRRLSLHFGNAEDAMPPTNMRLSQLRTLAFFGVFKCMPSIVEFRLLQVLILHFWGDNDSITLDLTRISELFRLKYLKVASNVTLELQTQMRGLQLLETLVIDARVTAVPSEIVHLPGLLNLRLPAEANLPNGIGQIMSLRTLGCFDLVHNSLENLQSLSRLSNLRDLQLTCCTAQKPEDVKVKMQLLLGSVLGELKNLNSLTVISTGSYGNSQDDAGGGAAATMRDTSTISSDGIRSVFFYPLILLQTCTFSRRVCIFSCLPKFIGQPNLRILKIGVKKMVMNDVDVLRGLPFLAGLTLYVHREPAERIVIGKAGFSVLRYFKFKCCDPWLKFEAGAMPNLRKLKLCFNVARADNRNAMPVGIEHLSGLKEALAKIGCGGPEVSSRKVAELAFRDAIGVGMHARYLRVSVQFVNKIFGCTENQPEAEYGCPGQYKIEEDFSQHDEFIAEESDEDDENAVAERERLFLLSMPPGAANADTAAAQESRREESRGGGSSSAASFTEGEDPSLSDALAAAKMAPLAAAAPLQLGSPHQQMQPRRKWGKWVAEIREPRERERIWRGSYAAAKAAARAYGRAVFHLRGRSARLNFPDEIPSLALSEGGEPTDGGGTLSEASIRKKAIEVGSRVDALQTGMMVPPPQLRVHTHAEEKHQQEQKQPQQRPVWSERVKNQDLNREPSPESSDVE